jgi:hypothetical protein
MSERPGPTSERDDASLAPSEERALESSVRSLGSRGRGPGVAAALIVVAFLVGLVRPWDWLASPEGSAPGPPGSSTSAGPAEDPAGSPGAPGGPDARGSASPEVAGSACGYPQGWRSATIQRWAGRPARVWSAVEVAEASGPADPSIPFQAVDGDDFRAIGWCAPVAGPDRPPQTARASLFLVSGGVATEVRYDRLEPTGPDALGELWQPEARSDGTRPAWPDGRYVIRLATPTGAYERYLGLDLGAVRRTPAPTRSPSPSASASAGPSSASPAPSPTR